MEYIQYLYVQHRYIYTIRQCDSCIWTLVQKHFAAGYQIRLTRSHLRETRINFKHLFVAEKKNKNKQQYAYKEQHKEYKIYDKY